MSKFTKLDKLSKVLSNENLDIARRHLVRVRNLFKHHNENDKNLIADTQYIEQALELIEETRKFMEDYHSD